MYSNTNQTEGNKVNKYTIRRLVAGAILTPAIAGIYWVIYAGLVAVASEPTATPTEVYGNGLMLGASITIVVAFYEKIAGLGEDK